MRKLLLALLLVSIPAAATVTVTGNVKTPGGTVTVGTLVRFTIVGDNCANTLPQISGVALNTYSFDFAVDSSTGAVTAPGGGSAVLMAGNNLISCLTADDNKYFISVVPPNGKVRPWGLFHIVDGAPFNMNTARPESVLPATYIPNAVLTNPTGNQEITQPDNTSIQITNGGVDFSLADFARPVPASLFSAFPVTCTAGQDYRTRLDPAVAGQVLYICNATGDGWNLVGDGGTGGGGGSGTVTSFTAGTLSPLFTTSVTNSTTTPALSFSLSTFAAHKFYGNNTGSTATPAASFINSADIADAASANTANVLVKRDSSGGFDAQQVRGGDAFAQFEAQAQDYISGANIDGLAISKRENVALDAGNFVYENRTDSDPNAGGYGIYSTGFNASNSPLASYAGLGGEGHSAAGTESGLFGVEGLVNHDGAGTTTNGFAFHAKDCALATGSITNCGGLMVDDITVGTNKFAIETGKGPLSFGDVIAETQWQNGVDLLSLKRFTDTSPTGNFLNFKSAANASLWTVDINGSLTVGIVPAARISGAVATATALAADGTDCSAGQYARGVDASGNAQGCTSASGAGTVTNSGGNLTLNAIMLGAGGADSKVLGSLGTTTTLLHGNAAGAPTFGAVDLVNDVTGVLAKASQHAQTVYKDAANTFSTGAQDFGSATSLKVPVAAGASPTTSGLVAYDSTSNTLEAGVNGVNKTVAFTDSNITGTAAALTLNGTNCSAGNYNVGVDASGNAEGCSTDGSSLTSLNASNLSSGTLPAGREPAHTGDVTNSAGSLALALGNIPDLTTQAASILVTNIAAPSTPASGKTKIYVDSTSKKLCSKDDAGSVNCTGSGGGSGTVTNTGGNLTNNQIMLGAGGADSKVGNLSGDATTSGSNATTVVKIQGTGVSSTAPKTNESLTFDGSNYVPAKQMLLTNSRRHSQLIAVGSSTTWTNIGLAAPTTTGTATAQTSDATNGPTMNEAQAAATINTNAGINSSALFVVGRNLLLQVRLTPQETTDVRYFVGLTDKSAGTQLAGDNVTGNYMAFAYCNDSAAGCAADNTNWRCINDDNTATRNDVDSGVAFSTGNTALEVWADDSGGNLYYKINGSLVCTVSAKRPTAGTSLQVEVVHQTLANTVKNVRIGTVTIGSDF
jgi:hypothetical protein